MFIDPIAASHVLGPDDDLHRVSPGAVPAGVHLAWPGGCLEPDGARRSRRARRCRRSGQGSAHAGIHEVHDAESRRAEPARVAALRSVLRDHPLSDRRTWEDTVRLLWDDATYREERYAATDLARHRRYVEWATHPGSLELFDHMIVSGAWWDHVDEISIRLVGPLLRAHPEQAVATVRRWSRDPDRWRRRAAVIAQIGSRDATDTALLAERILANVDDPDFFLRKGIGWALREHAKTDPDWVRRFTTSYRSRLSPLSLREATRTLAPS